MKDRIEINLHQDENGEPDLSNVNSPKTASAESGESKRRDIDTSKIIIL